MKREIESAFVICDAENIDDAFCKIDKEKLEKAKIEIDAAIFNDEPCEGDLLTILTALHELVREYPGVKEYENTLNYIMAEAFGDDENGGQSWAD